MAYLAGDVILDDEYNALAGDVNAVLGVGAGISGYGQSAITTVTPGTVISATQWATLLNKISTLANHQGSSITPIVNPIATDVIAAYTALTGNVTAIQNGKLNAAASGTAITAGGVVSRTTSWVTSVTMPMTVTFPSVDQMRYFFNAGGHLSLNFSRTGGTAHSKNSGWSALCTACGTVDLSDDGAAKTIAGTPYTGTTKVGGTGVPTVLLTGTGFAQLLSTDTVIFRQYDATAQYTTNYIEVKAKLVGTIVTLTVVYVDNAADEAFAPELDIVDGTLTTTLQAIPPSTTYLSNTWGTPILAGSQSGS